GAARDLASGCLAVSRRELRLCGPSALAVLRGRGAKLVCPQRGSPSGRRLAWATLSTLPGRGVAVLHGCPSLFGPECGPGAPAARFRAGLVHSGGTRLVLGLFRLGGLCPAGRGSFLSGGPLGLGGLYIRVRLPGGA